MTRVFPLVVAVVVAVSIAGFVSIALAGTHSDGDVKPGERLTGIIGVQDAELEGALAERTFGIKIAQAATNETKADTVSYQITRIDERLDTLEEQVTDLNAARDRGEITDGLYQAKMARVAAEKATLERLAAQSDAEAAGIPTDLLDEKGINVTAIQTLQERANELGGSEIADIARSIAGPDTGKQVADTPQDRDPSDRPGVGPPDRNDSDSADAADSADTENETTDNVTIDQVNLTIDTAEQRIDDAGAALNETNHSANDEVSTTVLEKANETYVEALSALDDAKHYRDVGDLDAALAHAETSLERAEEVIALLS